MKHFIGAAAIAVVIASMAHAQSPAATKSGETQPIIWTVGGPPTCADWIKDIRDNQTLAAMDLSWALGVISGMNAASSKTDPKAAITGHSEQLKTMDSWLHSYCFFHPKDTFATAAINMWNAMYQSENPK